MSRYLWILDNGHGYNTPGKRSPIWEDGSQLFEFEFNRSVVNKIQEGLVKHFVSCFNLVPDHQDVYLSERCKRANNLHIDKLKILISIHANAAQYAYLDKKCTIRANSYQLPDKNRKLYYKNEIEPHSARGIETFHYPGSVKGNAIATIFQKHLVQTAGLKNRGVKEANFKMLRSTNMPSILTENGFFTNKKECAIMMTEEYTDLIAKAHINAILETEQNEILNETT